MGRVKWKTGLLFSIIISNMKQRMSVKNLNAISFPNSLFKNK